MSIFYVHYTHPDEALWREHLEPHLRWIEQRIRDGSLRVSGPTVDSAVREGNLLMTVPGRDELDQLLATDPFVTHGVVGDLTIRQVDPIFGAWNAESSRPGMTVEAILDSVG